MTRDWKNFYLDFHIHHVTGTVHQWQPILLCPQITELYYQEYIRLSQSIRILTLGYVIMPEHFHLLVTAESGDNVLHFLHGMRRSISGKGRRLIESCDNEMVEYCRANAIDTALFYGKTAGKSDFRLWKEKPRVFPMNSPDAIQKKLDYIHLNPVRRGLIEKAEDWPHSSIRAHLYNEPTRIPIGIGPQDVGYLPS
jgi:putative transposase